jgi:phage virion morphogenesis protein
MAGAALTINVEINDREVLAAMRRLHAAGTDMAPVFSSIGERMLINTRARFGKQESPEGVAWAPLSPAYRARKKKNKDKILIAFGYLFGPGLRYQASASGVEFGTDRIQGATHQFGRGPIPARPFLGLSDDDRRDILDIVSDHLRRALSG